MLSFYSNNILSIRNIQLFDRIFVNFRKRRNKERRDTTLEERLAIEGRDHTTKGDRYILLTRTGKSSKRNIR